MQSAVDLRARWALRALEPQAAVVVLLERWEPSESCCWGCTVHAFTAPRLLFFYGRKLTRWIIMSTFKKNNFIALLKEFKPTSAAHRASFVRATSAEMLWSRVIQIHSFLRAHLLEITSTNSFLFKSRFVLALKTFPLPAFVVICLCHHLTSCWFHGRATLVLPVYDST